MWREYASRGIKGLPKKPNNIPYNPDQAYPKEFVSYDDWLGHGRIDPKNLERLDYKKASDQIKSLGLKSESEWRKYKAGKMKNFSPIPENIPKRPDNYYKDSGWVDWWDWLGKEKPD